MHASALILMSKTCQNYDIINRFYKNKKKNLFYFKYLELTNFQD